MLKQKVLDIIQEKLGIQNFTLLTPKNSNFGDYSIHKSQLQAQPDALEKLKDPLFEKIDEQAGFVNFYINKEVLLKELSLILTQQLEYGKQQISSKRIMFEYGQPNTHKIPHIGHLFSYCYGESSVRLLSFIGNTLFRANYQGDIGLHVAKCLWHYQKKPIDETVELKERIEYLQHCYQEGSKAYEENEQSKKEIDELNKSIYNHDPAIEATWEKTRAWCLEYYQAFEKRLGVNYDRSYFESEVYKSGLDIVKKNIGSIFQESEGAVIFEGEPYGLHTRVFINKHGNPTYEAKDIGLVTKKYEDWPFDKAIITTAMEQNEYWKVVKQAIELIRPDLKAKIEHIGFGMVSLKSGKMSSRTGQIVTAFGLVEKIKENVVEMIKNNQNDYSQTEIADISEKVTIGAVKYAFLKSEARKNMTFDIEESISIQGNSGPYLQYTYARCMSILRKSNVQNIENAIGGTLERDPDSAQWNTSTDGKGQEGQNLSRGIQNEEAVLLKILTKFPEAAAEAAEKYAPHVICNFLFNVAQSFNTFYEKLPILKASDDEKVLRLQLTQATSIILQSGLYLLGIEVVEKI